MVFTFASATLLKAEAIKENLIKVQDLLIESEAWTLQQQLLNAYRQVLLMDLEYALDKKVEQDLWNHAIKSFISKLQAIAKDKKHSKRSDAQALLNTCLEGAAGFYLQMIQEVCSAFQLDLPFRRDDALLGFARKDLESFRGSSPKKSSTYYLCQHCLVHLGDIARYRNQNRQAENFYKYAMMILPSSGQPYNQLAILEASRGDKVSAVYHYVRAIALSYPFPAAASNLSKALEKHCDDNVKIDGNGKLSSHEYLAAFLKLHGLLHSYSELDKAEQLVQILTASLTAHIATESMPAWKLVQIVAINIYAMFRLEGDAPDKETKMMTMTEIRVEYLISHYLAGCLNAFLLPVYTIKSDEALLEYFAMPAIKLTLDWIRLRPKILHSAGFSTRRQIWPSLCCLLKRLQASTKNFKLRQFQNLPLPEDRDLRGFLPLDSLWKKMDYCSESLTRDVNMCLKLRASRVVEFGSWLALQNPPLITQSATDGSGITTFEPVDRPELPGDLLKELEQLSQIRSPAHVALVSNGSPADLGASTPDCNDPCLTTMHLSNQDCVPEKKGILKSESANEKGETKMGGSRSGRNVALTALIHQKHEDVKQVTFRTPSPLKTKSKVPPMQKNLNTVQPKLNKKQEYKTKAEISLITSETDQKLLQQKKLLEVLTASDRHNEKPQSDTNTTEKNNEKGKVRDSEQNQQKQQVLSALFDESKSNEQLQSMSGLLNLNKQQQELLTISKQPPKPITAQLRQAMPPLVPPPPSTRMQGSVRPSGLPGPQSVVEKIEAARKEYEDAMFVLQQRKLDQSESLRYQSEVDPYRYERLFPVSNSAGPAPMMPPGPPPQPPPTSHVFVQLSQPMMGMAPIQAMPQMAFKVQPGMMMPWQESEQQPPLPPSWWTQPPPMHPGRDQPPPGYRQPPPALNTYSLWEPDPNMHIPGRLVNQQSFWSGPGPSPLERLLEQQRKQMRDSDANT